MADSPASTSTAKSASETRNTRQSPVQSKASSGSTISAATPRRSALRSDAGNGTPSSTSRGAQSSAPFIAPRFSGSNKSSPAQSSGRTSVGLRQRATSIRTKAAKEDAGAATISARENAENAPASSSASVSSQHGGSSITNDGATLTNIGHVDQEALRRVGVLPLWENALKLSEEDKAKHVIWLDIDNTLYRKSSRIAELMAQRIRAYFLTLGLDESEAERLHKHYYSSYGLAIKGLVRHHKIDPLDYDAKCDASLPLDDILKPDAEIQQLLADVDRTKTRIWALTNAYKTVSRCEEWHQILPYSPTFAYAGITAPLPPKHAVRVLKLLGLYEYIEGVIFCDYAVDSFVSKPDREYYDAALAHVGTTAEQSFFVDDSALNIRAAQDLGWRSCVLFSEVDEEPVELESVQSSSTLTTFNTGILLPKAVPNGNVAQDKTARGGHFDEELLKSQFRSLPHQHRVRLVSILFSAAEPADLVVLSRLLDRHLKLSRDMISSLPDRIITSIFEKLEVRERKT
ncbi:Haloacid dehalogenase-like hydrolase [Ceraceosorus bombacis]|uniref:Haloacid dehalogenase-like hydrolase n=1 Tax=Ceraceosorus bombacis TaxID=401625 RepID=A0A0P1BLL1_9BASI|nr:Haloacid dehalogenase-like hydrolase [Ceraceosorus bombacis]